MDSELLDQICENLAVKGLEESWGFHHCGELDRYLFQVDVNDVTGLGGGRCNGGTHVF